MKALTNKFKLPANNNRINILILNFSFRVLFRDKKDFEEAAHYLKSKLSTRTADYDQKNKRMCFSFDKHFFIKLNSENSFIIPIGFIKTFIVFIAQMGVTKNNINVEYPDRQNSDYSAQLNLDDISNMKPRDYQIKCIDILSKNKEKMLLMDMATGGGKGFCLAKIMLEINSRTALLLLPQYIEKWYKEFQKYFNIKKEEIYIIQGSSSIRELLAKKREDIKYKIFIISLKTISNYITDYIEDRNSFTMSPDYLMEHLSVGLLASDETHQHFHSFVESSMFLNTNKLIAMTATLNTNKKDVQKIYDIIFSHNKRLSGLYNPDNYVTTIAVDYNFSRSRFVRYKRRMRYDQISLEKYILRNNITGRDYLEMVYWLVDKYYLKKKEPGDKVLITASSVNMVTFIYTYLRSKLIDYNVNKYTMEDPYENLMESDICVSTTQSSSVGHDIKGLTCVIQLSSILSHQINIQSFGRLRPIANKNLYYIYTYTTGITAQLRIHEERRALFSPRSKEFLVDAYEKIIKN